MKPATLNEGTRIRTGTAWSSQPNKHGWWWWHHPEHAPLGVVVLVHDDNESLTEYWWAYFPKHTNPKRIWELPKGGSWNGPIAKPQMPNAERGEKGTHE